MSDAPMSDLLAENAALRAVNADLVAALKEARPYVQGQYDQLKYTNSAHVPHSVLEHIDAALARAEGRS